MVVVAGWMGAVAALGWALLTDDLPGRVIALAAVGLLSMLALVGTVVRPRLATDADGLRVGRLRGARYWPWSAVHRVEVVTSGRFSRRVGMLEIDAVDPDGTERLVVLTALDLGADPVDVAAELDRVRARWD
jgi:hypothetical protein